MDESDYEVASKVLASKHRVNILTELLNGARTPSELSDQFGEHQPTISRALTELKNLGLVTSTEQQRGRLYWIPDEKEHLAEYIRDRHD